MSRDDYKIELRKGWTWQCGLFSWTALVINKETGEPVKKVVRYRAKQAYKDAENWINGGKAATLGLPGLSHGPKASPPTEWGSK